MKYGPYTEWNRDDCSIVIRNAEITDAEDLCHYMHAISQETDFLVREPEEAMITEEKERAFLEYISSDERSVMLVVTVNDKVIGSGSVSGKGSYSRISHRCDISIALLKEYCGKGIGKLLFEHLEKAASTLGFEQMELEVIADNLPAIHLYESCGFKKTGTIPDYFRYRNGTYADAYVMVKKI